MDVPLIIKVDECQQTAKEANIVSKYLERAGRLDKGVRNEEEPKLTLHL